MASVPCEETDADAAGQIELLILFDEGQGQRGEHLLRHPGGVFDVGEALEKDGELIAPEAGHGIGFAHDAGQPLGDTAQHVVAGADARADR